VLDRCSEARQIKSVLKAIFHLCPVRAATEVEELDLHGTKNPMSRDLWRSLSRGSQPTGGKLNSIETSLRIGLQIHGCRQRDHR